MPIYPKVFQMVSFLQDSHRNLGVFLFSLMRVTCSNHLIVLDTITPIIYAEDEEEYKSWNSSLSSIFRTAVNPSPQVRMFSSVPFTRKPPVYILHKKWGITTDTHTHTRARARAHESKEQNNNLGVLTCTYLGSMQTTSYSEVKNNNYFQIFCIMNEQFKSSWQLTNLLHKFLFYNKFIIFLYMFRALCAHHREVKIVLYSIWYHHTL